MAEVDLHLHSSRSDGRLAPAELVRLCAGAGLRVAALTDHDSTEGIGEAREEAARLGGPEIIPGIELSCETALGEVHVLGLFVDPDGEELREHCDRARTARLERGRRMVERLARAGVGVSFERVLEIAAGGSVGRPHVARAMVEAGHVRDTKEAFDTHLGRGGAGYVARSRLTPAGAVEMLGRNGALAVLAHPLVSAVKSGRREIDGLEDVLAELSAAGLAGLEVHYGDYTAEQVASLGATARRFGLVPCGGSDYHGSDNPREPVPGSVGPPMETVRELRRLREARSRAGAAV